MMIARLQSNRETTRGRSGFAKQGLWLVLILSFFLLQGLTAQNGLTCNDLINISMNIACEVTITPDDMLEHPQYPDSDYSVSVTTADGTPISTSPTVTSAYIGQTLSVRITHNASGNTCWGNVLIEDKAGPIIDCADVTIDCTDSTTPGGGAVPNPPVTENCGTHELTWDDVYGAPCADFDNGFSEVITRTYVATDSNGNQSTCVQMIYVRAIDLDDIVFPSDFIRNCNDLSGGANTFNTDPSNTGTPAGTTCRTVQVGHTDTDFDLCGSGFKILRTWRVLDWCSSETRIGHQVIKLVDDSPPVVTAPPDTLKYYTDPGVCSATIPVIPDPVGIFDCSNTTYTLSYKLADENGDPFEDTFTENVIDNGDGTFGLRDMPKGTTWVIYTITDACGLTTQAFTEIEVCDHEPPTAVCEYHTVVSLSPDGWAELNATTLNDNSYDLCGNLTFQVKRFDQWCDRPEDLEYGDFVHFCCEDRSRGGDLKVMLRVTDEAGNFNECTVDVSVQDKLPPIIDRFPPDITVSCGTDITDPVRLEGGTVLASDNCVADVFFTDSPSIDVCGNGRVVRKWTITDWHTSFIDREQIITFAKTDPFTRDDITFPATRTVTGCALTDAHPDRTGRPTYRNTSCANLTATYEDDIFFNTAEACYKIIREWTVIDWCRYDLNVPDLSALWRGSQTILLKNGVAPTFTSSCADRTFTATGNCEALVDMIAVAVDDCADSPVRYEYHIDYHHDVSAGFVSDEHVMDSNDATGFYPVGLHRIRFVAYDKCDNPATCDINFTVEEQGGPTPICLTILSLPLDVNGEREIWAVDFIKEVIPGCSGSQDYTYSFSENTVQTFDKIDCNDFAGSNGVSITKNYEVWVTDATGSKNKCNVNLIVTDNSDACPDSQSALSAMISGKIMKDGETADQEVEVSLSKSSDQSQHYVMTDDDGSYAFEGLNLYDDYEVEPMDLNDYANGITTLDLILIQKHILDLEPLTEARQMIAADINNSKSITGSDIVELRKLILDLTQEFHNNSSWRYVDASFSLNTNDPYNFPERIAITDLILDEMDADFEAIKVGDVSGDASLNGYSSIEVRDRDRLVVVAADQQLRSGNKVDVNLDYTEGAPLLGFQFTVSFDPQALKFVEASSTDIELTTANYGTHLLDRGLLTVSWNAKDGITPSNLQNLIQLSFETTADVKLSDVLSINSDITKAEAYTSDYEARDIEIEFTGYELSSEFKLYQNQPNPFSELTKVAFDLPKEMTATLSVFSLDGKKITEYTQSFQKGRNEVQLEIDNIGQYGLLYYQLAAGKYSSTKKMLIIE